MSGNVGAAARHFERRARMRNLAIFRGSVEELARQSNVPIAQGGKMPVDTGFLRSSQGGSRIGMPYGPGKGDRNTKYTAPFSGPIELVTAQANLGETIWIGWTAMYARFMEARYGFMRSEAQNWPYIVQRITVEVNTRIP